MWMYGRAKLAQNMLLVSSWSQADIVHMFSVDHHQVTQSSHSIMAIGAAPHHVHSPNAGAAAG
jgi:hypothetical protein